MAEETPLQKQLREAKERQERKSESIGRGELAETLAQSLAKLGHALTSKGKSFAPMGELPKTDWRGRRQEALRERDLTRQEARLLPEAQKQELTPYQKRQLEMQERRLELEAQRQQNWVDVQKAQLDKQSTKQAAKLAQDSLKRQIASNVRQAKTTEKQAKAAKLDRPQVEKIIQVDQMGNTYGDLMNRLETTEDWKGYVGPLDSMTPDILKSPGNSAFRMEMEQLFNEYRKWATGVAAGEKELKMLLKAVPTASDKQDNFKAKITAMQDIIGRKKETMLSGYEKQGKDVSAFREPESKTVELRRKTKDGRTAIFDADTKEFIRYEE